jgi:hypothetical protein
MNQARIFILKASLFAVVARSVAAQGFRPEEAARRMSAAPSLAIQLVASEPMVKQPVAIEFDDRGRLWVIQYLQYPNPAGLARVSVDRYSRTAYDRVPRNHRRGGPRVPIASRSSTTTMGMAELTARGIS